MRSTSFLIGFTCTLIAGIGIMYLCTTSAKAAPKKKKSRKSKKSNLLPTPDEQLIMQEIQALINDSQEEELLSYLSQDFGDERESYAYSLDNNEISENSEISDILGNMASLINEAGASLEQELLINESKITNVKKDESNELNKDTCEVYSEEEQDELGKEKKWKLNKK